MGKCHVSVLGSVRNKLTDGTNTDTFPGYSKGGTENPPGTPQNLDPQRRKLSNDPCNNFSPGNEKKKTPNNFSHTCTLKAFKFGAGEIKLRGCTRGQLISLGLSLWYRLVRGERCDGSFTWQRANTFIFHQTASVLVSVTPHSMRT